MIGWLKELASTQADIKMYALLWFAGGSYVTT
jgi:hypothetical protein